MKVYVVCEPPEKRRIYDTWAECKAAVTGVPGVRYQSVSGREIAKAMLNGLGVILPPGTYAFTDGNAAGGVGVVFVEQRPEESPSVQRHGVTVHDVFRDGNVPGLESPVAVSAALRERLNVFAEMAGLYYALRHAPAGSALMIVHDYRGVEAWVSGRWRRNRGSLLSAVVEACRRLIQEQELRVTFRHQPAHQSTWCGRNDFAHWNAEADKLATEAGGAPGS